MMTRPISLHFTSPCRLLLPFQKVHVALSIKGQGPYHLVQIPPSLSVSVGVFTAADSDPMYIHDTQGHYPINEVSTTSPPPSLTHSHFHLVYMHVPMVMCQCRVTMPSVLYIPYIFMCLCRVTLPWVKPVDMCSIYTVYTRLVPRPSEQ